MVLCREARLRTGRFVVVAPLVGARAPYAPTRGATTYDNQGTHQPGMRLRTINMDGTTKGCDHARWPWTAPTRNTDDHLGVHPQGVRLQRMRRTRQGSDEEVGG